MLATRAFLAGLATAEHKELAYARLARFLGQSFALALRLELLLERRGGASRWGRGWSLALRLKCCKGALTRRLSIFTEQLLAGTHLAVSACQKLMANVTSSREGTRLEPVA